MILVVVPTQSDAETVLAVPPTDVADTIVGVEAVALGAAQPIV